MSKIIYPDNEVWAWGGDRDKPTDTDRFEKGNESGIQAKPPKHSDHNYQMHRADQNIQTILRYGITQYSPVEVYQIHSRCMSGSSDYISIINENLGKPVSDKSAWMPYINPAQWPVGSVLHFAHINTPASIGYPGTWLPVEAGASINSVGVNDASVGKVTGNNAPSVPLAAHTHTTPAHTHTVSGTAASAGEHTHTLSGTAASAGEHTHTLTGKGNTSGSGWPYSANDGDFVNLSGVNPSGLHTHTISGTAASAGEHTHTVSGTALSGGSGTSGSSGTPDPTINVQGKVLNVVTWVRTS